MANLAELDLTFSQPCKRCAQLLHGRVRFCPYCGGEHDVPRWGDEAANTAFGPGHVDPDPAEPVASLEDGLPAVEGHEVTETLDRSIVPEIRSEAREEAGLDIAHIVPAAFEWPDELPVGITAAEPRAVAPRGKPVLKNAAIGVGVAISVLALVLGYLRSGQDGDAGTTEAATPPQPAQVQNVPRLAAAAVPAELPAAAQVPAAAPVPVAPVVPVPAVAAVPASAMPAPEAGRTRCNEALAALALCPDAAGAR